LWKRLWNQKSFLIKFVFMKQNSIVSTGVKPMKQGFSGNLSGGFSQIIYSNATLARPFTDTNDKKCTTKNGNCGAGVNCLACGGG
jgi:hypothetical protein